MDDIDVMDDDDNNTGDEDVGDEDVGEMPVSESKRLYDMGDEDDQSKSEPENSVAASKRLRRDEFRPDRLTKESRDNVMSCAPSWLSTLPENSDPSSSLSTLLAKSDPSSSLSTLPEKSDMTSCQIPLDEWAWDNYERLRNEDQENTMSCAPSSLLTLPEKCDPSSSLSTLPEKSDTTTWQIPLEKWDMYESESCGNEYQENAMSCAPSSLSTLPEKSNSSSWQSTLPGKFDASSWQITQDEWDMFESFGNGYQDLSETRTENIDGNKLIMKSDLGLTEPPDAEEWHDAESIYLSYNKLSNLPEEPVCPKLFHLYLNGNYRLRKIPPAFFTNMPILQILNLSETGIMSLPTSLFELPHISELILKRCEFLMVLPPEVGKLKRLDTLDMEGTEIINLPIEIKELSLLRVLRVSLYGCLDHSGKNSSQSIEIIPFGVISALSNLAYIYIDVNPDDGRWDACVEYILKEVSGLTKLSCLGFYFPRVELLSCLMPDHAAIIHQLNFNLIVGGHSKRIITRLPGIVEYLVNTRYKCLRYINGEGVPDVIKKVLQNATTFHLDRHMTARKLTEFGIENMDSLEYCVLGDCNEMQVILDGNDIFKSQNVQILRGSFDDRRFGLGALDSLYIYYMKNLKSIWEGPVDERSLSFLKSLTLSTCPQLTTIFTVELLKNLYMLEELTVRDCPAIKSLVSCKEGVEHSANYLPQLRTISLHYVPELVSISSEVCIGPKLEELSLYNCPKLMSLSIKEVSSEYLRKITGEKDWWEALEWTQVKLNQLDGIFVPINEDTCF